MTERPPVHWGDIDADTAESAATLLENGEISKRELLPFNNIAITEGLEAVKEKVEQVRMAHPSEPQGIDTCAANEKSGYGLGYSQLDNILGQSKCDKQMVWSRPG